MSSCSWITQVKDFHMVDLSLILAVTHDLQMVFGAFLCTEGCSFNYHIYKLIYKSWVCSFWRSIPLYRGMLLQKLLARESPQILECMMQKGVFQMVFSILLYWGILLHYAILCLKGDFSGGQKSFGWMPFSSPGSVGEVQCFNQWTTAALYCCCFDCWVQIKSHLFVSV